MRARTGLEDEHSPGFGVGMWGAYFREGDFTLQIFSDTQTEALA